MNIIKKHIILIFGITLKYGIRFKGAAWYVSDTQKWKGKSPALKLTAINIKKIDNKGIRSLICQNSTEKNVDPVEAKNNTAEKTKITVEKVPKKNNFVEASTDNLGFGPIAVIK